MSVVLWECLSLRNNCMLNVFKQLTRDGASVHTNHCPFIIVEKEPKLDFAQVRFIRQVENMCHLIRELCALHY